MMAMENNDDECWDDDKRSSKSDIDNNQQD